LLPQCCSSDSLRERTDQQGINICASGSVKYGDAPFVEIRRHDGGQIDFERLIVSHGNFVVIDAYSGPAAVDIYGYFPGAVFGFPDRARPLLEFFPELAAIDVELIKDIAAVDGYIFMTISGDDGYFLFGARDPSAIPEPMSMALAFIGLGPFVLKRKSRA
jgi:hypothetical protein